MLCMLLQVAKAADPSGAGCALIPFAGIALIAGAVAFL